MKLCFIIWCLCLKSWILLLNWWKQILIKDMIHLSQKMNWICIAIQVLKSSNNECYNFYLWIFIKFSKYNQYQIYLCYQKMIIQTLYVKRFGDKKVCKWIAKNYRGLANTAQLVISIEIIHQRPCEVHGKSHNLSFWYSHCQRSWYRIVKIKLR